MGKDNAYFHTVFWPSVQLGDGRDWTLLHHISTTGAYQVPELEYADPTLTRILELRGRQVFKIAEPWCVWSGSQGDWNICLCLAVLFIVVTARDIGLHVFMVRVCEFCSPHLFRVDLTLG